MEEVLDKQRAKSKKMVEELLPNFKLKEWVSNNTATVMLDSYPDVGINANGNKSYISIFKDSEHIIEGMNKDEAFILCYKKLYNTVKAYLENQEITFPIKDYFSADSK